MGYDIGKAALHLQATPRVARLEFIDNWEVIRHFTGQDPRECPDAERRFNDAVHLDFLWRTHDGPIEWERRGRTTDMGHAVFLEDGSDYRPSRPSPFQDPKDVLAFNAVQEYGQLDYRELVTFYDDWYRAEQAANDQVVSGGYYRTLVSGAIAAFGWEMLLLAVAEDPQRFGEKVLGSIFEVSLHHFRAWADTSIECFMCHDDMVWTQGPFLHPDFYRAYVFPRYRELWRPLKEAGKKVLFTSDGTFDMFLDDIAEAGADGFCFEPSNDLEGIARRFGNTHVLMGGADCRTLAFGTPADIERELRWAFRLARQCPGFFFVTANHFPANIPLEHALLYFRLADELGRRD